MNLSAYDIVKNVNDIKTWIDVKRKRLYSVELPFYIYFYIGKRYEPYYKKYSYYIIFTNEKYDDPVPRCVYSPRNGRIILDIKDIWSKSILSTYKHDTEIKLKLVDKQSDCVIYLLDI